MEDIKLIVSKRISELRQRAGMTQLELAEKLNYSDKAVSKWERGESIPDVSVLVAIADMFNVPLDYMVKEDFPLQQVKEALGMDIEEKRRKHVIVTSMSIVLVWSIAALVFIMISVIGGKFGFQVVSFLYAVPTTMIVWLVFNSVWFNKRLNYLIISLLMWSILVAFHLSFLWFGIHVELFYLLGIPGQLVILLWSMLKKRQRTDEKGA